MFSQRCPLNCIVGRSLAYLLSQPGQGGPRLRQLRARQRPRQRQHWHLFTKFSVPVELVEQTCATGTEIAVLRLTAVVIGAGGPGGMAEMVADLNKRSEPLGRCHAATRCSWCIFEGSSSQCCALRIFIRWPLSLRLNSNSERACMTVPTIC